MADEIKPTKKEDSRGVETIPASKFAVPKTYPYSEADSSRIEDYKFYKQLFEGAHFDAFKQRIKDENFNKAYAQIRYIYVNFAGMISRIVADMLFGEPVKPKLENKEAQAWVEDFWKENNINTLLYESGLSNSALGDALLKLRVAKRQNIDPDLSVILEQTPPSIYFPHVDGFNVNADPEVRELAWKVSIGKGEYLRREIHKPGIIFNELYLLKGAEIQERKPISLLGIPGLVDAQATNIDRHMLIHVPNWRISSRWNGYSDYNDLDAIFFSINNRISMIDNVLDKHTDPILMVPPGVIGEDGKVKKDKRVIEMGEGEDGKPEYVVWDASLENAFKQIDKLVEIMFMVGEISPDALGMGKGQADSGRALKLKLLRTIAKVSRKKLYYDRQIKEALYVAQLLAKKWGAKAGGKSFDWEPEMPELIWQDGLPTDKVEEIENEVKKVDAGLTSEIEAIMKLHQVDEETAKKMQGDIKKENEAKMPDPLDANRNPFSSEGDKGDKKPEKKPDLKK